MAAGWSSLPADILNEISGRLNTDADQLHAHQVCAHWRASISPPAAYRPWVVAARQAPDGLSPVGEYSLQLPRGVPGVDFKAAPPGLPYCCGTPRGWFALADDVRSPTRLVMWEPHSGTEIPLPCLSPVVQVFLSSDPLESSHWMAVATKHRWPEAHILFFWRPGDAAWSGPAKVPCAELHSVEFHAGNIYCIDGMSNVSIYDLKLGTASPPVLLRCFGMSPNQASESWETRKYWKDSVRAVHVVACRGELLLVLLFHGRRPSLMEVYRPAWTPAEWPFRVGERVTDLGDYALFLGCGDAVALSAKEYPAIRGNCVYYLVHNLPKYRKHWAMVYDLGTGDVDDIPYPAVHKQENGCWPYSWFCPRRPFLKKQLA
ncbi:unnamed protein product [Triticum turgidum subsp. durum]|uniref:KIB1-4 beta-propeller domain-containing protein n=1 Tax=Triticum turgidum subsp. durum TaxID=4567 RepID=A0A9R0Q965_TRITD|nr:unnamed protein product [Triticum turgidum subsp. durum]